VPSSEIENLVQDSDLLIVVRTEVSTHYKKPYDFQSVANDAPLVVLPLLRRLLYRMLPTLHNLLLLGILFPFSDYVKN
jgi:hypothetical protein